MISATPAPMMAVLLVPVPIMAAQAAPVVAEAANKPMLPIMVQKQFRKTRMCDHFARGRCRMGSTCRFAHSPSELSSAPDLRKTKLCLAFARGQCHKDDCDFAHGPAELRGTDGVYKTELCHSWAESGRCRFGSSCRFAHGAPELRPCGSFEKPVMDHYSGALPFAYARQWPRSKTIPGRDRWSDLMQADEVEALKDESGSVATLNFSEMSSCGGTASSSDEEFSGMIEQTTLQTSGLHVVQTPKRRHG